VTRSTSVLYDPLWTQHGLDIDGETYSVSLSADGNVIAIGSPYNDNNNGTDSGCVRVYYWNTSTSAWTQRGSNIDGKAANENSGWSVSLSSDGNIVAIGSPYNDGLNLQKNGRVRVYSWIGYVWTQLGIDLVGAFEGDKFGWNVSLSNDGIRVAISAPYNVGIGGVDIATDNGYIRIYNWKQTSQWDESLIITGEAVGDQSGYGLSLSADGKVLAIGAPYNDNSNGTDSGHVIVYFKPDGSWWTKRGSDIDGEAASDRSGWSVSLSADGNVLAIGAPYHNSSKGHVRVYDWNTSTSAWTKRGSDIDGEAASDRSGWSVSLSADGNIVAIGAPYNDGNKGHVRVYYWNTSTSAWTKRGSDIDGKAANENSGWSVSLSAYGNSVAIGAYNSGNSGQERVYFLGERFSLALLNSKVSGGSVGTTTMTDGFIYIPGANGPPANTPTTTSSFPLYYDSTNKKLCIYDNVCGWLTWVTPDLTYTGNFTWTSRTSAGPATFDRDWFSVAYGNGLWVAVANNGTNRVITSPDGITWTSRTTPLDTNDNYWQSVAYGNGLWVAVAWYGIDRVMTSPDGIAWTIRTSANDNPWQSVAYGNGLWVAVSTDGTGNRVMTSPDGTTWTIRTSAADNSWQSVDYGNGLWVAVAMSGTNNRVMTSPDGITWTSRTSAADYNWCSVAYGNGLWVAVSNYSSGGARNVMTSTDGTTWTLRTGSSNNSWRSVAYGHGLWVAVSSNGTGGNRVMTSPDGTTWTSRTSAADNDWHSVAYGNDLWVAVASTGTGNRVMTMV
jgi:hypothetical protein